MYWMLLFAAAIGSPTDQFEQKLAVGPFPTETSCAAAAALGIDRLNGLHPDQDFRAACSPKKLRRPGDKLYTLQELAELATRTPP